MSNAHRELVERVVFSLLGPAARLAERFELSIKQVGESAQLAAFHSARRRGAKLRDIVDRLGVSMSMAARLSKKLKRNFLRPELEHELPCRIEFMLWPGPLGEARIAQALPDVERDEVHRALRRLEAEGRIEPVPGRTVTWRLLTAVDRRVVPDLYARIDALNSLCAVLGDAVYGRFFADDARAFARSVMLRVRPGDLAEIEQAYRDVLWPLLVRLDEAAKDDPEALELGLALLWAPHALLRGEGEGDAPADG